MGRGNQFHDVSWVGTSFSKMYIDNKRISWYKKIGWDKFDIETRDRHGSPERGWNTWKKQLHIDRGNFLVSFADCNISHFKGLNYEKLHLSGRTTVRTVKFHEVSVLQLPLFMARALYEDIASRLPAHSMISSTGSTFTTFALQQRLTAGYRVPQ